VRIRRFADDRAVTSKKFRFTLIALSMAFGVLAACGEEEESGPDGGEPTSCGTSGEAPASSCTGLDECGAGPQNYKPVSFCENCFAGSDTHVCEAGSCRALDRSGSLRVSFGIPEAARGAKSFAVAVVLPLMADGTRVSCAALLTTCDSVNNRAINTSNATFQNFVQSPDGADPTIVYTYSTSADVGVDRLVVITATSDTQGKGSGLAAGCVDGLAVTAGETTRVDGLELTPS
jgi:hypothetical protein